MIDLERQASIRKAVAIGRIPSTLSQEEEEFLYKTLEERGRKDVADQVRRERREA